MTVSAFGLSATNAITLGTLPSANQYATSYSHSLTASGGASPYSYSLVSQSGRNPNTWQIVGGSVTNLMPMLLNVETATLMVQVTDANSSVATLPVTITVNRQVPAGASALGYNTLIWTDNVALSEISFATYGSTITSKWQAGWPYNSTAVPSSLFSTNAQGVLEMTNTGGATGQGPASYRPVISSVQLSNGSNVPIAAGLATWPVGSGYYIEYSWQVISPNSGSWITGFQFPTQHNIAGTQQVDPYDGFIRFLEFDTNEGSASNGQTSGYGGNVPYWSNSGGSLVARANANPTPPELDATLQHTYGMSYNPTSTAVAWYADNTQSGSISEVTTAAATALTPEQLSFVNAMTDYAIFAVWNNTVTGYSGLLYYVSVYGP
jgi:hypothetical protein